MNKIIKIIFIFIGAGLGAYLGAIIAFILGFHENIHVRSAMLIGIIILAFGFAYIFSKLEQMKYFKKAIYILSVLFIIILIVLAIKAYMF